MDAMNCWKISTGATETEFYAAHCQRKRYDKYLPMNRKQWLKHIPIENNQ